MGMVRLMREDIKNYIRRIRNPPKKAYAQAYAEYLLSHEDESKFPEAPPALSYLARQAVRLCLRDMFDNKDMTRKN